MTLSRRLKALEEKTKPANPEPRQRVLMVTPNSPEWFETIQDLVELGLVRYTDAQDSPQSG
jgi:hypothetical protein